MSEETFDAELSFGVSLSLAGTLLRKGLQTEEEYRLVRTELLEKYRPVFGLMFSSDP